jgi:pantetheine-phosphate adenylyltransferase
LYPVEQRVLWIQEIFKNEPKVKASFYEGLTVNYCKEISANYILRGIRNMADFDYEKNIAQMNKLIYPEAETVFLMCDPAFTPISSSVVRDLIRNGGDVAGFIPDAVKLV